ncbi:MULTISPECIES: MerR family transcriptional regulator [Gordonia]|uniref:MerR family transcriptional regulator n=1 Tax=Gordonia TaxID=2053 RepID=UPI0012BB34FA|nr:MULTISPECIES: MerR family transcriptional regulator [Gordonia]MDH3021376.1 MerR family transcriptional regulator [Gordonia alkanivorans]MDH3050697.1 MerR family transcriptional regulator [Gordonia alkanivorans]MDJ0008845.1 MerR family transcriptional regulator [Gordonia alkanivorans]MDJ0029248.1 MerR family transcriptional regulator [Gordonia alkanivorans]MDJ0098863.1 MerR family transcriptional regulator [Gordonia alkanivorans]
MSEEKHHPLRTPASDLTVGVVAGMVGVSVRTLHHYDQIGLVTPSRRTPAGYRVYDDADVARLYRVLTYRELGFSLGRIATLLDDPDADELHQLRAQHELLTDRIDHLHRMVAAVEEMMMSKKQGIQLSAAEQREIFGDDWRGEEYAAEAEERWGETAAWQESRKRVARFSKEDWRQIKADADALERRLADAMLRGLTPGSAEADALAEEHRAQISRFYDCTHEMHVGLADMYVADPRFTAHYDEQAPGLAVYLREVIRANAEKRI